MQNTPQLLSRMKALCLDALMRRRPLTLSGKRTGKQSWDSGHCFYKCLSHNYYAAAHTVIASSTYACKAGPCL